MSKNFKSIPLMKTQPILTLILILFSGFIYTQNEEKENLILELLELEGVSINNDQTVESLISLFKNKRQDIPDSVWIEITDHVKKSNHLNLRKDFINIYKDVYSQKELVEIIAFLQSESGQKYLKSKSLLYEKGYELGEKQGGLITQEILHFLETGGYITYEVDRNECKRFHEGKFKLFLSNGIESHIEKQGNIQTTTYPGSDKYTKYKLNFLNDCEYSMELIETNLEPMLEELGSVMIVVPYEINGNILKYKAYDQDDPFLFTTIGEIIKIE